MKRVAGLLLTFAALGHAQSADTRAVRSWFTDGTGLEIYSESVGPEGMKVHPVSRQGIIGITYDKVNRFVSDTTNNVIFGYYLQARRSPESEGVLIRIEPFVQDRAHPFGTTRVPTVATVREFPSVKVGEVVTLDILYNPMSGQTIRDVIRPITDASPSPSHSVVTAAHPDEQISLKEISLRVNGQPIEAPYSWMLGGAARIDVPGHGLFVLSAVAPGNPAFRRVGKVEGTSLSWMLDGERVEITSHANVLTRSMSGDVWVYHDPRYKSADSPGSVTMQAADTVEWLLPKK